MNITIQLKNDMSKFNKIFAKSKGQNNALICLKAFWRPYAWHSW